VSSSSSSSSSTTTSSSSSSSSSSTVSSMHNCENNKMCGQLGLSGFSGMAI
jgi:hypothetical protein